MDGSKQRSQGRAWSQERITQARSLASQGRGVVQIAREMKADPSTVRKYVPVIPKAKRGGVSRASVEKSRETLRRKMMASEKYARAKEMFAAGASRNQVRRETGLSDDTISRYFPGEGWGSGGSSRAHMLRIQNDDARFKASHTHAQIKLMIEDCVSINEICRTTGVGKDRVHRFFPEYKGWTKKDGIELRRLNQRMEVEIAQKWGVK